MYVTVGEKESEDKDLNSEAPSSVSEATSEKESNNVSQSNAVSSRKDEEQSNSIKKVSSSAAAETRKRMRWNCSGLVRWD